MQVIRLTARRSGRTDPRHEGRTQMVRKSLCALGLIAALLAAAPPAPAQTALGTVRGAVLDQQGAVLPGVTITLRQVDTNTSQTVVSTPEGRYIVPNLRPG